MNERTSRIGLRAYCALTFLLLVSIVAGGLLSLHLIDTAYQRSLFEATRQASEFVELHSDLKAATARRQAALLAFLFGGQATDLRAFEQSQDEFFRLSMRLVASVPAPQEAEIADKLATVQTLDERWRKSFAEPMLAARRKDFPAPVSATVAAEQARLAEQLAGELDRVGETGAARWDRLGGSLLAAREAQQRATLLVMVMSLLACGLVLMFLTRGINQPLTELNRLTQVVLRGGSVQPATTWVFRELRHLFDNFSIMVHSLQERESQLLASHADTARTNQDLVMLTDFAKYLQQAAGETEIGAALVGQVRRVSIASQIGLYLKDRASDQFVLVAVYPEKSEEPQRLRPSVDVENCRVVRSQQPLHVIDSHSQLSGSCQECEGKRFRSELCLPLSAAGVVVGTLHVSSKSAVAWSSQTIDLITSLANLTAPAISNLRALDHLRERATRDPLTGAFNRRYLEEFLIGAIEAARRERSSLSVLLFDIDHFKQVNDQDGHAMGDRVLMAVADVVRKSVRASDVLCRYGGEEFVVVLPKTAGRGAATIAEKIRARIAAQFPGGQGLQTAPLTVSIGIAVFPKHGDQHVELVRSADRAMYRAKSNGRNCVELFDAAWDPVAAPADGDGEGVVSNNLTSHATDESRVTNEP